MSALKEIKRVFQGLQTLYQSYLPKVDPILINDLLSRQLRNPKDAPFYLVEIFTKPGINEEEKRKYIIEKTGMVPSIHDNGTHYVTNHRLTIELLQEFSNSDDVVEITGDYTGGLTGVGASHSRSGR
ncbi:MAG: hypothetical protein ACPKPY_02585 [Nitrososphaeraceae archaeon]